MNEIVHFRRITMMYRYKRDSSEIHATIKKIRSAFFFGEQKQIIINKVIKLIIEKKYENRRIRRDLTTRKLI